MRATGFCLLLATSVAFTLFTIEVPLMLPSQAADDRVYYNQFKQVAAFVDKTGHLPTPHQLLSWGWPSVNPAISVAVSPAGCEGAFEKQESDRFVLSFWRGEWFECYAYPSGKTSLPMSVSAYLLSGLGFELGLSALVAGAAGYGALRLLRGNRRVAKMAGEQSGATM